MTRPHSFVKQVSTLVQGLGNGVMSTFAQSPSLQCHSCEERGMEKLKKTQTIISDTDGGRCEKASEGAGEGLARVVRKGIRTEGMQRKII